ncbi:MAG: Rieske (2Fe-2S) protein [Proteobacteria bacterium]|nr:Rieske (2Fe-2S) protein [Pseudomonadota bacterium]
MAMQAESKKFRVCELSKLREMESCGWEGEYDGQKIQCFLVYQNDHVYSYINRCPHTGVNLDWTAHQFLDSQKKFIQCSTHGALFKIEDGTCLHGPCIGDRLKSVKNVLENGQIYLLL